MSHTIDHIDKLIGKVLSGEASKEEQMELDAWANSSSKNRAYLDQFKLIFERAAVVKDLPQFNTDAAWENVRKKLVQEKAGRSVSFVPWHRNVFMRVAASLVIMISVGYFIYQWTAADLPSVQLATTEQTQSDTLPDGTAVFVNKGTVLAYAYDREARVHKVTLKGEAYFDISEKKDRDFIVQVDELLIKDIGTSFNVKAYPEQQSVEVFVEEGEVVLYTNDNAGLNLREGERGMYNKRTGMFSAVDTHPNVTAYKTRAFVFNDMTLGEVVELLNAVYDQSIELNPALKECRLTVNFNNEQIGEIVEVIAATLNLKWRQEGERFILDGTACQ